MSLIVFSCIQSDKLRVCLITTLFVYNFEFYVIVREVALYFFWKFYTKII